MFNSFILPLFFLFALSSFHVQANEQILRPVTEDIPQISPPSLHANDELGDLENLMVVTRKNLEGMIQLRNQILSYQTVRKQYEANTRDRELSTQLVIKAHEILLEVERLHLAHLFDQEFLSEIAFFSRIAEKWNTPSSS